MFDIFSKDIFAKKNFKMGLYDIILRDPYLKSDMFDFEQYPFYPALISVENKTRHSLNGGPWVSLNYNRAVPLNISGPAHFCKVNNWENIFLKDPTTVYEGII